MKHEPSAPPQGSEQLETVASRYRLVEPLGSGGMAEVFAATDALLNRRVAVKRISSTTIDKTSMARFAREARAQARVNDPSVVTVFDVVEDNGHPYLVMELVDGITLRRALATEHRFSPSRAVSIASGIASGLAAAHAHGVVHRDLKPSNVFLTTAGTVKIGDFGIAKVASDATITRSGEVFGSAPYIAPEQVTGGSVDGRTDLYSLGCVLFEMLTGRAPFEGEDPLTLTYQHVHDSPVRVDDVVPTVPPALASLVERLLAKDPRDRPQSAEEVRRELSELSVDAAPVLPAEEDGEPTHPLPTRTPTAVLPPVVAPSPSARGTRSHRPPRSSSWVPWVATVAIGIVALLVLNALIGDPAPVDSTKGQRSPAANGPSASPSSQPSVAQTPAAAAAALLGLTNQLLSTGDIAAGLAGDIQHGVDEVVRDLDKGDAEKAIEDVTKLRETIGEGIADAEVSSAGAPPLQAAVDRLATLVGATGGQGAGQGNQGEGNGGNGHGGGEGD